ncbi:hypothetical protein MMC07_002828 [Pseudocyphellaria aurata]|nr:hypothetical protein [Pseudocyphellaria aurata]
MAENNSNDETNYFVCTLGEATGYNAKNPHRFTTVNDFLDHQSTRIPNQPAVVFPIPSQNRQEAKEWDHDIFTFSDLRQQSIHTAKALSNSITRIYPGNGKASTGRTVALLCPSSVESLFAWLGLMRLGFSVLLIAPQCQPSAIAHLCKVCETSILFYDETYQGLAKASAEDANIISALNLICLQAASTTKLGSTVSRRDEEINAPLYFSVSEYDVAYLHHTSGTSTGLPKPIAQTHRAAVGVLPTLATSNAASFTTTPLYHGGVADCFRAWTSDALIWLFPGKDVPITTSTILCSLDCAKKRFEPSTPPIKYFSCVPYILQMLAADEAGLNALREMDLVGVGGAALPYNVGDGLVQKGVKLLSRFGSAECGFIMSSHRDYSADEGWQYLRSRGATSLDFEAREQGLVELIIRSDWPHMAKRNREDGSFATADLFEPHPTIPDAWRYHSRADSQLTLITGKKFDPAPLEDAIASSPLVDDVLIFGNGKQYPGALLFRSMVSANVPSELLLRELWPLIEKLNNDGQTHTKLSRSMLVIMPSEAKSLEKSSKGTLLRGQAERRYQIEIDRAYQDGLENGEADGDPLQIPDREIPTTILEIIKVVITSPETIPEDSDFFALGVDSVACIQIRALLQKPALQANSVKKLLPSDATALPLNVVYDCGTIKRLSQYILNARTGKKNEEEDEIRIMRDLTEKYSSLIGSNAKISQKLGTLNQTSAGSDDEGVVILTGATGALGAHILDLLRSSRASQIICLVRATSLEAANARVNKALLQRQKPPLEPSRQVRCLPVKVSDPELGLSHDDYVFLVQNTTLIIHAAWAVNFSMRLRSFEKDHIAGLSNLINLALHSPKTPPPRFLFCSSIASVLGNPPANPIAEQISHSPESASPLGYSRSKWVAEAICEGAHTGTRMQGRIAVLRIGQLCGDTQSGIWNVTEAWPLMLSSVTVTNSLPRLENEPLAWLPVDQAARAVVEIAHYSPPLLTTHESEPGIPVFHLVNPDRETKWSHLLAWMSRLSSCPQFDSLPPNEWVQRLENLRGEDVKHPARKLLGLWKTAYCTPETTAGGDTTGGGKEQPLFEMAGTCKAAAVMNDVRPVSEEQFGKIWEWLVGEMEHGDFSHA